MYLLWVDPEGKTVFMTRSGDVRDFRSASIQHGSQTGEGTSSRAANKETIMMKNRLKSSLHHAE